MLSVGFEPVIHPFERLQSYTLVRTTTGIGKVLHKY